MEDFKQYIKNKKVALVGPANYMKDCLYGDEIEAHDVVVRINRGMESIGKYFLNIGSRTDILYSCLIEKSANAGKINLGLLSGEKVKYICCPPESNFEGISKTTRFHPLVNFKKMKSISEKIPIRIVDHEFHTWLARKVKSRPNTGFLAIYDFLRHDIQQLSIYGFSFYLDGFLPGQKSGVKKEKDCTEQQFADLAYNSKRHNQKNMWTYAKKTLRNNSKVNLDNTLTQILALEKFNRESFNEKIK